MAVDRRSQLDQRVLAMVIRARSAQIASRPAAERSARIRLAAERQLDRHRQRKGMLDGGD